VVLAGFLAAGHATYAQATPAQAPRFRLDPVQMKKIAGVTAAEAAEFTNRIKAMHEFLGAIPDVRNPVPPECTYVYSNTEVNKDNDTRSVAASSVIGFMTSSPTGPCPRVDNTSITLRINDVRKIYLCSMEVGPDRYCTLPAFQPGPGGFLEARGRQAFFLYVRGSEPLMEVVTKADYLRAWEREMLRKQAAKEAAEDWLRPQIDRIRARLASLTPEQRSKPACRPMAEAGKEYLPWEPGSGDCAAGTELGQPNPRLLHSTPSPVDVESILVSTVTGRTVGVSVEAHAHKERVLRTFDFEGLLRSLTR